MVIAQGELHTPAPNSMLHAIKKHPMNTKLSVRPTRKRYHILALIFVTVVINYMDRSNISVAAFAISD
jgi:hypothetical protein